MKRAWKIGTFTAGLVVLAAALLLVSGNNLKDPGVSVAGVVPGTSGTVLTVANRDEVIETQGAQSPSVSRDRPPLEEIPGKIFGPLPTRCTSSLVPIKCRNSWTAGGFRGEYYLSASVLAGGFRRYADTGLFFIVRNESPGADTKFSRAFVPRSGPVEITDAPLGEEGSARVWDAHIGFKGTTGMVGYLDLADDSVHITGGPIEGVCPAGTSGTPPNCAVNESRFGSLKVRQSKKSVRPGGQVAFRLRISSVGDAALRRVKVCGRAPRKLIAGKRCFWVGKMPVGRVASGRLRFRVKKKVRPGRQIALSFRTHADPWPTDPGIRRARATIRVR